MFLMCTFVDSCCSFLHNYMVSWMKGDFTEWHTVHPPVEWPHNAELNGLIQQWYSFYLFLSLFLLTRTPVLKRNVYFYPFSQLESHTLAIEMFHSRVLSSSNTLYLHWCYFWCDGKTARTFSSISVLPQARTGNAQAHVLGGGGWSRCTSLQITACRVPARDKKEAPLLYIPMWNYSEHNSIPSGLPLRAQGPFDTR